MDSLLPALPESTAALTVTTTVWVGVCVVVMFNTRLGWSLSGLVVPGYLVPLLIVRPVSVAVVVIEAVLSYWLVRAVSDWGRNSSYWSSLFGRDRFFALILASVLVRVGLDGYILPWLGAMLNEALGIHFNYEDQLHSVGLVVVALIANYFWKPGLLRGLGPLAATTAVTFLLVRFVLMGFTGFGIGGLRYVYDDVASSLLASPKAYMLLLTGAYIASRMNLRYAWEYNGILIPSLLALQWCEPIKIATTLAESLVVLVLSSCLLKLPLLRRTNIQDGRKIALFFTVAFLYRLGLDWSLPLISPMTKVTDFHGFGYLLSTLLAIRFHEKQQIVRICRATLQVSLLGAAVGSAAGFLMLHLPSDWLSTKVTAAERQASVDSPDGLQRLIDVIRNDKLLFYESRAAYRPPSQKCLSAFRKAVELLLAYRRERQPDQLASAVDIFGSIHYETLVLEDRFVYLRGRESSRGWGAFVINLDRPNGLLVSVPYPMSEPYSMEAGLSVFRGLDASGLAVAGAAPFRGQSDEAKLVDAPDSFGSLYTEFHRLAGRRRTLQVRGYNARNARRLLDTSQADVAELVDSARGSLWISNGLPEGLDLTALRGLVGDFRLLWAEPPLANAARQVANPRFAELYLNRGQRAQLFTRLVVPPTQEISSNQNYSQGQIVSWLLDQKPDFARAGTELYRPAQQEELVFLDHEVLTPLLDFAWGPDAHDKQAFARQARLLSAAARTLNYEVVHFQDTAQQKEYLILQERRPLQRHWGTYVFSVDPQAAFVWEVPRPLYERHSMEFGVASFMQWKSAALLVAGAHVHANRDGSADVARSTNKFTLFNLVHQAVLRQLGPQPALVVQSRAIKDPVSVDVVMATDDGSHRPEELTPLKALCLDRLVRCGMEIGFVDGQPETAGYEVGTTAQLAAMEHGVGKEFVSLWLSPSLRSQYRQQTENELLDAQMTALGIPTLEIGLFEVLASLDGVWLDESDQSELQQVLFEYLRNRDIVRLQSVRSKWPQCTLQRVLDPASRQAFLLVCIEPGCLPLVVNLSEPRDSTPTAYDCGGLSRTDVKAYIESRATWFQWRETP